MDSTSPHRGCTRRRLLAYAALVAVTGLPGCRWWPTRQQSEIPVYTSLLTKDELVRSLNANIEPVSSWRCTDASVKARGGMMGALGLNANLAVERPRNFRMLVKLMGRNVADLGSNDERFWFWFDGHPQHRTFTARHEDTEYAQRVLQIPFEPDWLLEALGVVPLNPDEFEMIGDGSNGTVSLVSERMTSSGRIVRRVVLVDTRHRVITAHALYDGSSRTHGWIARASLSDHRPDPRTGLLLPRQIDLEWPQHDLFLTMTLNHVEVNPPQASERIFAFQNISDDPVYEISAPQQDGSPGGQASVPFHAGPDYGRFAGEAGAGAAVVSDASAYSGPASAVLPSGGSAAPFEPARAWTEQSPVGSPGEPAGFGPPGSFEPADFPSEPEFTPRSDFGASPWSSDSDW